MVYSTKTAIGPNVHASRLGLELLVFLYLLDSADVQHCPGPWLLHSEHLVSKFIERNPSVAADNHSLPTYAKSLGMTGTQGTLMLALINMGVVFGAMSAGALNDRMHVSSVMALCSIGAAGAVFLFWGLSVSLPMLCVFSLLYGLTAGGFSANYTGIVQRVKESDAAADSGMIFGFLAAGRGIGAVASGPLSEALLHMQMWKGEAKLGYGTGYGLLIVFTGITAAVGGTNWLLRRIGFT